MKLTKLDKQTLKAAERAERRVVRKARAIVEQGAVDATAITAAGTIIEGVAVDEKGRPEGWSARRLNVARDMRESKRNAPIYLDIATRIVETADKLEAAKQQAAPVQLNIGTINVVTAPEYEVIDVTETSKG